MSVALVLAHFDGTGLVVPGPVVVDLYIHCFKTWLGQIICYGGGHFFNSADLDSRLAPSFLASLFLDIPSFFLLPLLLLLSSLSVRRPPMWWSGRLLPTATSFSR